MRHKGWKYIDIAAGVLRAGGRPLRTEEIVDKATRDGLLRSTARSPAAAMRARLSSEVRRGGFKSIFQRVGANRFALREWGLPEYFAAPFRKAIPEETVVCLSQDAVRLDGCQFGVVREWSAIRQRLGRYDGITFQRRREVEERNDVRQLVAYAVLRSCDGRLLTYRRGQYSSAPALIRGARCLGFGGHVLREDAENLFGTEDAGVIHAAYREISEELDGTMAKRLDIVGVICDDSSPEGLRHLGIVIEGELPRDFTEDRSSRERAVNDLQFLNIGEAWQRFHEFEFWSQLVLKEMFPEESTRVTTVVRPRYRVGKGEVVLVAGEIATGKTTFSMLLRNKLGFGIVSTRACVAGLVGLEDFGTGDRAAFQEKAAELVGMPGGVDRLVQAISEAVGKVDGRCVIDGVRHRRTIEALRERYEGMVVVFVDCARDDAYRNYRLGSGRNASVAEFRSARAHEVEAEVGTLRHDADAYLFNGGRPAAMLEEFRRWWVRGEESVGVGPVAN